MRTAPYFGTEEEFVNHPELLVEPSGWWSSAEEQIRLWMVIDDAANALA